MGPTSREPDSRSPGDPRPAWLASNAVRAAAKARNLIRTEYRRLAITVRDSADRRALRRVARPNRAATVMVHFADTNPSSSLYQLRQWYGPLAQLDVELPVAITTRSATVARTIASETHLPVHYLRNTGDLERYMAGADPRVVLYVNHWSANFQMMRHGSALHVFISHGESEKAYMASGQLRCYDFSFIAGPAAADRILAALPHYDVAARTRQIGRPQLDSLPPDRTTEVPFRTVLYAPTYEGDRPSMAYSSVLSHGTRMVASLLAAGHRVIYRPHPMTGTISADYARADQQIRAMLTSASERRPAGMPAHLVDTQPHLAEQLAESDVAIVDNSAMAFDWLVTGKPLIVTLPDTDARIGLHNSFLSACYRVPVDEAGDAADLVARALGHDTLREQRAFWIARHFGDTTPGASMRRFIDATAELARLGADEVERTRARARALHARNIGPGTDPTIIGT